MIVHTAPLMHGNGGTEFPAFGSSRLGGFERTTQGSSPAAPIPFNHSSHATPEDRQRAVANMLARGGSFSEKADDDDELTSDSCDSSPYTSPARPIAAASAPADISFCKEEVTPAKSYTSGLAGIHRPSLDGRPVIKTPNRYTVDAPPAPEYSESGHRKANQFKCSIFLPTPDNECLHLQVKLSSTAAQLVLQILTEYLRSHPQPHPTMLGQPVTYRLYLAEDDGEIDDAFPPLNPDAIVKSTGADCFVLQRKMPTSATLPSVGGHSNTTATGPASASSSRAHTSFMLGGPRPPENRPLHLRDVHPRIQSLSVDSEELSVSRNSSQLSDSDFDPSGEGLGSSYQPEKSKKKSGGSGTKKGNNRTSSDADAFDEDRVMTEEEAIELEMENEERVARGQPPLRPSRHSSAANSAGGMETQGNNGSNGVGRGRNNSSTSLSGNNAPAKRSRSFTTPLTWKNCFKCACFSQEEETETEQIQPNSRR